MQFKIYYNTLCFSCVRGGKLMWKYFQAEIAAMDLAWRHGKRQKWTEKLWASKPQRRRQRRWQQQRRDSGSGGVSFSLSPFLPFSLSPFLPFSLSPFLPFSLSPFLPFSLSPFLPFSLSLCASLPLAKYQKIFFSFDII
jgi:hypothetical protein